MNTFESDKHKDKTVQIIDIGLQKYTNTWDLQKKLFLEITQNRKNNYIIITEHYPVITMGTSSAYQNIISDDHVLKERNIEVVEIDRGGDVTFHGPGQIVVYPIFDLNKFKKDIHWFLRSLEEVVIVTLHELGISSKRVDGLTGVWVKNKKICAIGIKVTRWVTMHGFALNVNTNLDYFNHIIPCGIQDKTVTSIKQIKGNEYKLKDIKKYIIKAFQSVFKIEMINREYANTI